MLAPVAPRVCGYDKCRAEFFPRVANQRYHAPKCAAIVDALRIATKRQAEQAARRATKGERHPRTAYIREMMAEEPGMCPFGCERPLDGPGRVTCGHRECLAVYQRVYKQRTRELERKPPEIFARVCACGCRESFTTTRKRQRYVSKRHANMHWKQQQKAAHVAGDAR